MKYGTKKEVFMNAITTILISIIVALPLSIGVGTAADITPEIAANGFFNGLSGGNEMVTEQYIDNDYVNFIGNNDAGSDHQERLLEALFANFSYEVTDRGEKGTVAVLKLRIKNTDFSGVQEKYEKAAHEYIMDNLYSKDIEDKKMLSEKCLELYLSQLEEAVKSGATAETEIFLPMTYNGDGGWHMEINDKIMKAILGNLTIPMVN
jgi:hypothetical protein